MIIASAFPAIPCTDPVPITVSEAGILADTARRDKVDREGVRTGG